MMILTMDHVKVSIAGRTILDIERLEAHQNERIGLVGRNGQGKTTLLNCILRKDLVEEGMITVKGTAQLVPQLKETGTTKSGGETSAEYFRKAFSLAPSLLLADEPTTNLDASHVEWVQNKLQQFNGTLILVSHDRELLDHVCTTIWELESGQITSYPGNYTHYLQQKEQEQSFQQTEHEKYKQKEQQLQKALEQKKQKADRATKAPKNLSASEKRIKGSKPYFAKKQKKLNQNAKSLQTRLEKLEKVEKPTEFRPVKMDLPNEKTIKDKVILRVEESKGKAGTKLLWENTSFFLKGGNKVALMGPNGSGKTTFLKKIIENNVPSIIQSPAMKIGYFAQDLQVLDADKSILENVSEDSLQNETFIRTVLARLHFYQEDVHKPVKVLSGGERVKTALAKIFVSDSNTLILDEPTNYLDIYAMEALESLLKEYEGTILFVSHDRRFISSVADHILAIENQKMSLFEGTYHEFLKRKQHKRRNQKADDLLRIETAIAEVLGQISLDPANSELEAKFQGLISEKRTIQELEEPKET